MKVLQLTTLLFLSVSLINCSDETEYGAYVQLYTLIQYVNSDGQNLFDQTLDNAIDTSDIMIYYETLDQGYSTLDKSTGQLEIVGNDSIRALVIHVTEMGIRARDENTSYIKLSENDFDTLVAYVNTKRPGYTVIDSLKYNGKLIEPWIPRKKNLVTVVK